MNTYYSSEKVKFEIGTKPDIKYYVFEGTRIALETHSRYSALGPSRYVCKILILNGIKHGGEKKVLLVHV